MSKENKSDKFYELFPEVCDVIDKARRKYYLDVSDGRNLFKKCLTKKADSVPKS